MPAPAQLTPVAYLVVFAVPLLLLAVYLYMFRDIGRDGMLGASS